MAAAAAAPEMQRWKAMVESFLPDSSYGVGVREGMVLEKLNELLLSLSALVGKLDRVLPAAISAPPPPTPHLHDGGALLLAAAVLVAAVSLAGLFYFFRAGAGGGGGGVWAARGLKAAAVPAGGGEGMPTMSEHECMFLSVGTLLLVITVLGSFYYYYCYQAGCFGTGDVRHHVDVGTLAAASAGRKLRVL